MLTQVEFIQKCLELVELHDKCAKIAAELREYADLNGSQEVGPVKVKVSYPRKKYDYEQTWNMFGFDTDIDIADYIKETDPVPAVQYVDYMAAVKDAKIKPDRYVVTNKDEINNKSIKVEVRT